MKQIIYFRIWKLNSIKKYTYWKKSSKSSRKTHSLENFTNRMKQIEDRRSRLDDKVEKLGHSIQENKNLWMEYVIWDTRKTYLWGLRIEGEEFQAKGIVDSFTKISKENLSNLD